MDWRDKFNIDNLDLKSESEDEMEVDEKPKKSTRKPRQTKPKEPSKQPRKRRAKEEKEVVEKHTAPESFMGIPEEEGPYVRPHMDPKKAITTPQGRLLLNKRKSVSDIDPNNISQQQATSLWEQVLARKYAPPQPGPYGNMPQFQPQPNFAAPKQVQQVQKKGVWEALFG